MGKHRLYFPLRVCVFFVATWPSTQLRHPPCVLVSLTYQEGTARSIRTISAELPTTPLPTTKCRSGLQCLYPFGLSLFPAGSGIPQPASLNSLLVAHSQKPTIYRVLCPPIRTCYCEMCPHPGTSDDHLIQLLADVWESEVSMAQV